MILSGIKWKPVDLGLAAGLDGLLGLEEATVPVTNPIAPKPKKRLQNKRPTKNVFTVEEANTVTKELTEKDLSEWTNICVPRELSSALVEANYTSPTEIQRLTIPAAIKGRKDILGAAETGSGKTLAFALPLIYGIIQQKKKQSRDQTQSVEDDEPHSTGPLALVITPTRELALQIKKHFAVALKYTKIRAVVAVGGLSLDKQTRELKSRPEIVIGTPGRLFELISAKDPHLSALSGVRFLVIDEADRLTEKNHFLDLTSILEHLNAVSTERQNFVFSATLTFVHAAPKYVKKRKRNRGKDLTSESKVQSLIEMFGMKNPKIVDITRKEGTASLLNEFKVTVSEAEKECALVFLLMSLPQSSSAIIFVNSITMAKRLSSQLRIIGLPTLVLHASMDQKQRLKNLDKFRAGSKLLLATDVAARGLDIPGVNTIIHYHVPRTSENYIHRSGRTARAGASGTSYLLIAPSEISHYRRICGNLNRTVDLPEVPIDPNAMTHLKKILSVVNQIDALQLKLTKNNEKVKWTERAAEELDIVLDDDQKPLKFDNKEVADMKKSLHIQRKTLSSLMTKMEIDKSKKDLKFNKINSSLLKMSPHDENVQVKKKIKKMKILKKPLTE